MAADDHTPSDLRKKVLAARRLREKTVASELRDAAPDYDDDEPSVVEIRGPAAERFVARLRKDSPVPPSGPESIRVKAGKLLEKRFGKTIGTVIMVTVAALFAALVETFVK